MIKEYFDPVELEKPDIDYLADDNLFCRNIAIHTADQSIKNLSKYHIALIGVGTLKGKNNYDIESPNRIRAKIYELYKITNPKFKIIDLGNLKSGTTEKDLFYGLRDVLIELHAENIIPIVFGGNQEIVYASSLFYDYLKKEYSITTIHNRLNFTGNQSKKLTANNYIDFFLYSKYLLNYSNLGHQACFINNDQIDFLEANFYDCLRLGTIRYNHFIAEPYLRDSNVVAIDMNSIKHSDAPGQKIISPNGLYAEEVCQLSKYSGLSENLALFFLTGYTPSSDINNTTAALGAQCIWYFLDGVVTRRNEKPDKNKKSFKKYILYHKLLDQPLVFLRSNKSDRWWIEVPRNKEESTFIACTEDDYQAACNEEIPSRWWNFYQRFAIL